MKPARQASGFSLVELCVASALLVVACTLSTAGFVHLLKTVRYYELQNELDVDVQTTMEKVAYQTRLSSLQTMFFHPAGPGPYTAMSFPMARDDDGDGAVDTDADGAIIWDKTVIYHVWEGQPHQLRMTVFDPRDNTLSDVQRQEQLERVVANGNGAGAHNGVKATTTVVFQNLFCWSITPRGSVYDGYAPAETREAGVSLGSCLLGTGAHQFTFTVSGKNTSSSGYRIGLDSLVVGPSRGAREAEGQLPPALQSGVTADREYMPNGSWSGNYRLIFPATGVGQSFTLAMDNDAWEETTFARSGDAHDHTVLRFDTSLDPHDYVVALEGLCTNWMAAAQTGDAVGSSTAWDALKGCAVRVVLKGDEMWAGGWIGSDGARCKVNFRAAAARSLVIQNAYIGECASAASNTADVVPGSQVALTFSGAEGITVSAGGSVWSDIVSMPISRQKSYVVSYLVARGSSQGNAWRWRDLNDTSRGSSYVIPGDSLPTRADLLAAAWSARTDVLNTNAVLGAQALFCTHPTNGTYTSSIYDTQMEQPSYTEINWDAAVPAGANIDLRVRTGNDPNLSDALPWSSLAAIPTFGVIDPGHGRYVQFQATLSSTAGGLQEPRLKGVHIRWHGPERVVDIGGSFAKGPSFGTFEVTVDGKPLVMGLRVDLRIFKDYRGFGGAQRVTSSLVSEINPRNTGL